MLSLCMHAPQLDSSRLYSSFFILLCLSQALFSASFNMIVPELPDFLRSLGGEDYIGLIIALFTTTAGLSRPFSGKLTDTIGRMPVQVIGTLVCVLASLMYPFVSSVFGFLLLRFFHGFSTGFKPTAAAAYLADIVPVERRGEAMGIMGVSMNLGASIAPPIGSQLAISYSLDVMFYCSSAIALVSVLLLFGMKESLANKQKFSPSLLKLKKGEIYDRTALLPASVVLLLYMSIGALVTIGPDQSVHLGMTNKGFFFTSYTLCSILSRLVAGKASDKYGRIRVIRISLILLCLGLASFALVTTPAGFLMASGFLGFAMGSASPPVFAWVIDRCQDENRGKALATIYIALEISIGFGAVFSAEMYDSNPENFGFTFLLLTAITSIGFIILYGKEDYSSMGRSVENE